MIEINVEGEIGPETLVSMDEDNLERMLNFEIASGMSKQVIENLDNVAFLEMEHDDEKNAFVYKANLIVCSKDQVVSSVQIMAQRLAERLGATQEDIEYCLESAVNDLSGF